MAVCTHLLLQLVLPVGHRHWPPPMPPSKPPPLKHWPPGPHEFPQAPQLFTSFWVKVHEPPHWVWPPKHIGWQLKPVQTWPN